MTQATKEYKAFHRKLFPKVKPITSDEAEKLVKQFYAMNDTDKRIVTAMIFGTMSARVTSPDKVYQSAAWHFFNELKKAIAEKDVYK
jgi:hypothetical protein